MPLTTSDQIIWSRFAVPIGPYWLFNASNVDPAVVRQIGKHPAVNDPLAVFYNPHRRLVGVQLSNATIQQHGLTLVLDWLREDFAYNRPVVLPFLVECALTAALEVSHGD